MDLEQLCDPETLASWVRAYKDLLDAIPRNRIAGVFRAASYVEAVATSALAELRKAKEQRSAAQTG